MYQRI